MSDLIIKLAGQEQAVNSTPNTVTNSAFLRLVNTGATPALIQVYVGGNNQINSAITMLANSELFIAKGSTDTVVSNTSGNAVVGAYVKRY